MNAENVPYVPGSGNAPAPTGTPPSADVAPVRRLVIFAPNWLGDAVMALPAIADVGRAFPGTTITVAARRSVAPLFALVPGATDVLALEARRSFGREAAAIRERDFDAALLLPNSFRAALLAWRAGVGERWGYRAGFRGPLLTRAIAPSRDVHQAISYQRLVRSLGAPNGPLEPRLEISEATRLAGAELLRQGGWDGRAPLIALAPGAAYGGAKRWPAPSFAALAAALQGDGAAIVLLGSAADRAVGGELIAALPRGVRIIDLVGTDLAGLAGILIHCRALVSNDSGAMHFAAALGLPVTALFGPTDERMTGPLGPARHVVLSHRVWCRPCGLRECPLEHGCMRGIGVEAVLAAARRSL